MTLTATDKRPSSHIELSDGSTTIPLMLVNGRGENDPRAIQRTEYPRMSTRIPTGEAKYSDFEWPYKSIIQDDWSSGRGKADFEVDKTRYMDACRVITEHENQVILSGQETYTKGHRNLNQSMPGSMVWTNNLYGSSLYIARKFTPTSNYTASKVMLWIKKVGSPSGTLNVRIYNDSAGSPGALITGATATLSLSSVTDTVSELRVFSMFTPPSLVTSTDYWVVIYISGYTPDSSNHITLGSNSDSGMVTKISADGTAWSAGDDNIYFRVIDNTAIRGKFLEYKRALYFLSQPLSGAVSYLYLNGDRGIATSGGGITLTDTNQTWVTDEWAGCTVLIIKGTGADQQQPWRTITSNTSTALTISPAWDIDPASGSEYVILGSNKWKSWKTLTNCATDAVVAGDAIFIAYGDYLGISSSPVDMYSEWRYGTNTYYTKSLIAQSMFANNLLAIRHPTSGVTLWGSVNQEDQYGVALWKASVPPVYDMATTLAQLYTPIGTLVDTDDVWDERILDVSASCVRETGRMRISVSAAFTTGMLASERLATPVDITGGTHLAFLLKSSVETAYGDLELRIDDTQRLRGSYIPENLWWLDAEAPPSSAVWYNATNYIPVSALTDRDRTTHSPAMAMATTHYLYIGYTERFDRLKAVIATPNSNTAALAVSFCYGSGWSTVSGLSDGTASGGVTLAQNGEISWTLTPKWQRGVDSTLSASGLSSSLYWVRLSVDAALSTGTSISVLNCENENIEEYVSLSKAKDARTFTWETLDISSDDYIVVMHSEKFNKINIDMGSTPNAVVATMTASYFDGNRYPALTITDGTASGGAPLAQDGDVSFTIPDNWEQITINGVTGYVVRLTVSADLTGGITINEISVKNDDCTELNLPVLYADEWQWVTLAITPKANPNPDHTQISSVGLYLNTDLGTMNLYFGSPIYVIDNYGRFISVGNTDARIRGLEAYGDERENPWVFKEDGVYEIQTQNSDSVVPIPLREIKSMRSENNGKAHTLSSIYMVFNLDQNIERYYQHTLDDIGPNRDEGMPSGRSGTISSLISYPGRIFASIDGESSGYSSALVYRNSGWHELYRAPYGERISNMIVQVIPGMISRLWFAQGSDIVYIPLPTASFNPLMDSNYTYTHEGHIITGWISADFLDVSKMFKSVKLFTENLTSTTRTIKVEYQTESGSLTTGWTELVEDFNTSPYQEVLISNSYNITARRIRFRIRMFTTNNTYTPVIKASVVEALIRLPVKYSYTMKIRLEDFPEDNVGGRSMTTRIEDVINQLATWADAPTALTLRTVYSPYDNKRVVLEAGAVSPIEWDAEKQFEKHIGEITLLEI